MIRSSWSTSENESGRLIDLETGRRVMTFSIGSIKWVNPITVNVKTSGGSGLMGQSGSVFVLRWSPWGWSVMDEVEGWAS